VPASIPTGTILYHGRTVPTLQEVGTWHDLAPGETGAQLDVTFYDPALSSLVDARQGKDRVHHDGIIA
jgi:hypothetical protein